VILDIPDHVLTYIAEHVGKMKGHHEPFTFLSACLKSDSATVREGALEGLATMLWGHEFSTCDTTAAAKRAIKAAIEEVADDDASEIVRDLARCILEGK